MNFLEFRMYTHNLLCFLSYKAAADSPEAPEYLWNPYGVLAESPQKIRWAASIKMRTKRLSLLRTALFRLISLPRFLISGLPQRLLPQA